MKKFFLLLGAVSLVGAGCLNQTAPPVVPTITYDAAERLVEGEQELGANQYTYIEMDLNGDGVSEHVTLEIVIDEDGAPLTTLWVGEESTLVPGNNPQHYFGVVDLDTEDGFKEVVASDLGPSGDPTTNFYHFNGTKLLLLGTTQGLYEQMTFDGQGMLTTRTRGKILDTWFYNDSYILTESHTLEHVDQDFYVRMEPPNPMTVLTSITLQTSPTDPTPSLILQKGDGVAIVGCDDVKWCKVRGATGAEGWFALEDFDVVVGTGLHASEIFDGLSYAD